MVDIAIIGAGPYGMSIAAHLRVGRGEFRIFGRPMHTWLNHMPQGMYLKSEGFASTLYDPESEFTLAHYCHQQGVPYADIGLPISLSTFSAYGQEFQQRMVPTLENTMVASMARSKAGFQITLETGEVAAARRVVVAVGLSHFQYVPPVLSTLPEEFATHSSAHRTFERFQDRNVTVIGAGASAADVAAALLDVGARVQIVARKPVFRFHDPPGRIPRPLLDRIRFPMTGLGPGWRSLFCTSAPLIFRQMPERFRLEVVRKHLGPAAGWVVRERVQGQARFHLGSSVEQAKVQNGRVHLDLVGGEGGRETLESDHVIAATGYTADLGRVSFLNSGILSEIQMVENTPILSSNFESSVPGLYFVGNPSANTFGPLVRFAFGAGFTARRISRHLTG
jgi:thioredoxin reductase